MELRLDTAPDPYSYTLMGSKESSGNRISGIDSIRWICAVWVLLSHYIVLSHPIRRMLVFNHALGTLFNGPAAVVVFFVISGFCIHHPNKSRLRVSTPSFYMRRYVRIGLPLVAGLLLGAWLPQNIIGINDVIWSLYCEVAYYTLYPLLLAGRRRWGWIPILLTSYVAAFTLICLRPHYSDIYEFGIGLTWIWGLPCWILGCMLAEIRPDAPPPGTMLHHGVRLAVFGLSWLCLMLRFHAGIGYPVSLHLFAILAAYWLSIEISWYRTHRSYAWMEWAGSWSYSLYLGHAIAGGAFLMFSAALHVSPPWIILVACAFLFSYVFWLTIERPAHLLARRIRAPMKDQRLPALAGLHVIDASPGGPSIGLERPTDTSRS